MQTFIIDWQRLNSDLLFAQEEEAKISALNALLGDGQPNKVPRHPLPIGPYNSKADSLLSGLLYGGECVHTEWFEYLAGQNQTFNLPENCRYAIIYPEHDQQESEMVGKYSFLTNSVVSSAAQGWAPIHGKTPIKISGGKNLLNFQFEILIDGARFNVFYFG